MTEHLLPSMTEVRGLVPSTTNLKNRNKKEAEEGKIYSFWLAASEVSVPGRLTPLLWAGGTAVVVVEG